ncbi:signal peptidase II [Micromonospora sp. NBC_01813]|uniref:signal peptidase II n=1 Tax=Micromonospora sp. NBC_01813 TaxID=2975988 RepID=UPI003FA3A5E5
MSADPRPRPAADGTRAAGPPPSSLSPAPDPPAGPEPVRTRATRRALWIFALVAVGALLVDLGTKQWALSALADREPVRLLGGALYLTLIRNSGAAFSIGSDHTWIFPLVTVVVLGWIGWLARGLRSVPWAVALGLILGGALGNFLDRMFRAPGPFLGHVVDMFSVFHPHGQVFPIFNIADSALVVGVVLAVLLELTGRQRDGRRLTGRAER